MHARLPVTEAVKVLDVMEQIQTVMLVVELQCNAAETEIAEEQKQQATARLIVARQTAQAKATQHAIHHATVMQDVAVS